jgi:DNA-binding CsgD family transcriptional regulator
MMRVPNALLADVYSISPSSVSVRKQRMKKKLDSDVQNQTIENYLNQYIL